jgi:rSAM/selenodomain-associated transferase 1
MVNQAGELTRTGEFMNARPTETVTESPLGGGADRSSGTPVLLVFARRPVPGQVKTRLAGEIGGENAARLYARMAEDAWAKTESTSFSRWLVYTPADDEVFFHDWLPGANRYLPQTSGSLGKRMEEAIATAFGHGADRVGVVGTDLPDLDASIVERSFDLLPPGGAVLGPSFDGGFWLLALSKPGQGIFAAVDWESPAVFERTRASLTDAGYGVIEGPQLRDVDTARDLRAFPRLREELLPGSGRDK